MKPHNGILLMLVYGIFGTAAQEHSPECACIDPWLAGLHGSNLNNRNSDCAFQAGADGDGICYSGSYGLGCRAHDQTQDTCIGEQRPKWCDLRWCWVDPRTCLRPHDSSSQGVFCTDFSFVTGQVAMCKFKLTPVICAMASTASFQTHPSATWSLRRLFRTATRPAAISISSMTVSVKRWQDLEKWLAGRSASAFRLRMLATGTL
eukprot:3451452-Pleurochrysis_carterae.AAC.3